MIKKLGIAVVMLLLFGVVFMAHRMLQPPPADLDLRQEKMSQSELYRVRFEPETGEALKGGIHAWLVTTWDASGKPVTGANIEVDGGMPQHGHGLPTDPAMREEVAPGVYRIDGVKFSMSGWWKFDLEIDGSQGKDIVTFNVVLD